MFSENKKEKITNNQQNRIVEGTKIEGKINSNGGFRIDGTVEGDITAKGKVVLGPTGKIKGTLTCENADIEGSFTGKLYVRNLLSLKSTAVIQGEVVIEKLSVAPGALFNATCVMGAAVKTLQKNPTTVEEKTA